MTVDATTQLPNRRGFDFADARFLGSGHSLRAMLMVELTNHSEIAVKAGTQDADAALRELGALMSGVAGADATVAHFGGAEFAVMLPVANEAGAFEALDRITAEVRLANESPHRAFTLRIDVGVAVAGVEEHGDFLLRRAHRSLLRQGRQRPSIAPTANIGPQEAGSEAAQLRNQPRDGGVAVAGVPSSNDQER